MELLVHCIVMDSLREHLGIYVINIHIWKMLNGNAKWVLIADVEIRTSTTITMKLCFIALFAILTYAQCVDKLLQLKHGKRNSQRVSLANEWIINL